MGREQGCTIQGENRLEVANGDECGDTWLGRERMYQMERMIVSARRPTWPLWHCRRLSASSGAGLDASFAMNCHENCCSGTRKVAPRTTRGVPTPARSFRGTRVTVRKSSLVGSLHTITRFTLPTSMSCRRHYPRTTRKVFTPEGRSGSIFFLRDQLRRKPFPHPLKVSRVRIHCIIHPFLFQCRPFPIRYVC